MFASDLLCSPELLEAGSAELQGSAELRGCGSAGLLAGGELARSKAGPRGTPTGGVVLSCRVPGCGLDGQPAGWLVTGTGAPHCSTAGAGEYLPRFGIEPKRALLLLGCCDLTCTGHALCVDRSDRMCVQDTILP